MKRLLLLALFVATSAIALPEAARQGQQGWKQWGSGEMTWFGFSLYRATLWVAGASPESAPSALQLDYRRDISRERLVSTSLDEMRRLGADEAQLKRWETDLRRVFPDVKEGDSIVGVHYPGRGASFYHQGQATGDVVDAEFARRFFAIWLDPASRSPALRAVLLKRPEG
ncbi:MAG: chalcone isomerase family protein [Betaproteobacteria bacterium]